VKDFTTDEDAVHINRSLGLGLDEKILAPVMVTAETISNAMSGKKQNMDTLVKDTFQKIAAGKDLVLVGGAGALLTTGSALGLSGAKVAQMLDTKVLLVTKYSPHLIDEVLTVAEKLGKLLIGLIINAIPTERIAYVKDMIVPYLSEKKIDVLSVIPYDTILGSVSVEELAQNLGAEILCAEDKVQELIQHFIVGAMTVESAMNYFRRISDKAVITGGDRSDIQLAAMDTSTICIILTGNLSPTPAVLNKAKEKGIPLLSVKEDTLTTVEKVDQIIGKIPVRGMKKVAQARMLFDEYVDFKRISNLLGF